MSKVPLSLNARFRWDIVRHLLEVSSAHSTLEFGPGEGAFAARLATVSEYFGIELDDTSRWTTESVVSNLGGRVVANIDDINPDKKFDLVCAFEVLEHVEDDKDLLLLFKTRLKEDGRIVLSFPAHRNRYGKWDKRVGHLRRYDRADVFKLVEDTGLELTGLWSIGWPVGCTTERVRNFLAALSPGAGSNAERTALSGRLLQPGKVGNLLLGAVSPLAIYLHRRALNSCKGNSWVVECRQES